MRILVLGATGATGTRLTEFLLSAGHGVKVVVRSHNRMGDKWKDHSALTVVEDSLLDLSDSEMSALVAGCDAVVSCLGHNLSFKGIYGKPRRLVTDACRRLCAAVMSSEGEQRVKFVLMNTTGVRNRDLHEPISVAQHVVIGLLRLLLPPHVDNEKAADFFRREVGQDHDRIEWVAVRPDGLINEESVSEYEIVESPNRSAIFDPGKVSRINVAHFMGRLIEDETLWARWKGKMPVIYSKND